MSQSIIEKIQKLIAKAQGTDSPQEAETFMLHAQKLMQEYNLEMSHVEKSGSTDKRITEEIFGYTMRWEATLMDIIARNNFCKSMNNSSQIYIFGRPENVNVSHYLFNFFKSKMMELGMASFASHFKERLELVKLLSAKKIEKMKVDFEKKYMNDYMLGAIDGIEERMDEQAREASRNNSGMAGLVLSSEEEIMAYIRSKYKISYGRYDSGPSGSRSGFGYENGVKDGKSISASKAIG